MFNKFIILFLCFNSIFIFSEGSRKYNILFEPLSLKNMDESYSHLSYSYPGLILSKLQNAKTHHFSEAERNSIRQKSLSNIRNEYLLKLSGLIIKHDKYIFSRDFNDSEYKVLEEKINKQKILISEIDQKDISEPKLTIPIYFTGKGISSSVLKKEGEDQSISADLIISGSIEKLDDWVYTRFWVENTILDSKDLIFESAVSIENLNDQITEISSRLKTLILGHPWSEIQFNFLPKDAVVHVLDNTGLIVTEDPCFYYPGTYNIEISKSGYISKEMTVEISENETKVVSAVLEEQKKTIISLQTFPSGANLYSGSMWLGKTPVLIENPLAPSLLTVKLEGYNDSKYIFTSKDDRDIRIFLHSDLMNYDEIVHNKRNQFYKSFSYFLLSMPLSLVSYGFSSDYGYTYNREVLNTYSSSESDRLMQLSTTWYNVYLSSVFINVTLFINTIIDLVDYIRSNNDL